MRLKYQLFLSLLLISALLIAMMYVFNSWNFNRGFLGYLNSVDLQKHDALVAALEDEYMEIGSWARLETDDEAWRQILQDNRPTLQKPRRRPGQNSPGGRDNPQAEDRASARNNGRGNDSNRSGRTRGNNPRPPRMVLANAEKEVIRGPDRGSRKNAWRAIVVNDETVGFIGVPSKAKVSDEIDQVFAKQQSRSLGIVALVLAGTSALLALLLSSRLVKPIVDIKRVVENIRGGEFEDRIQTTRKDELGELATDINHLALTLEQNRLARRQWIAEISHELRTPVAVLQSEIESIQDGVTTADTAAIESLHGETVRLSRLINDLHELSASDLGSLGYQMEDVQIDNILRNRVQAGRSQLDSKNIEVSVNSPDALPAMLGDAHRLGQMVDNLLQNSARYTDPDGRVAINLRAENDSVVIEWSDSSPGVPDPHLGKLFDPLYRTDESRNRETGGSGLGLAIVSKIAQAHRGTISASHSPLGGLSVTMTFPVRGSHTS